MELFQPQDFEPKLPGGTKKYLKQGGLLILYL